MFSFFSFFFQNCIVKQPERIHSHSGVCWAGARFAALTTKTRHEKTVLLVRKVLGNNQKKEGVHVHAAECMDANDSEARTGGGV